ncbi:GNAT family N-acetyltransferase [Dechloromonas sp. CZR5]|uniref:GNAT family N-acetyltransferase n=1 Tax=Dechloromonas sp. CZR5 TaxID=2608630 RepID=UPI001CC3C8AE|nr:GNAT family N-acetyltransferase [Dechloromonas sp. CZR5]
MIQLETSRLRLRPWRDEDLAPFAALNADAQVMAHFPATLDRAESDVLAARCQSLIEAQGWGFWATEIKASGDFIGFVGLHRPIAELPFSPCVEIGWRLARPFWGQGYASEAARAALSFAFNDLALAEVVAFTSLENRRSQAVMERLGMRRAENFEHPAQPPGHPLREHCLYRLAVSAWQPA